MNDFSYLTHKDHHGSKFWNMVDIKGENSCWLWKGSLHQKGYGRFRKVDFTDRYGQYAHRIAYALWHGSLPENMRIYHNCRNRSCCNPKHLYKSFPTTQKVYKMHWEN